MFVEVGSDSDNNYNLVHPRRKIIAVQEDIFFLILVVSVQSRLSVVQKKIISWWGSRKRMIFQTVDELQSQHPLLIVSDHQFWTAENRCCQVFITPLSAVHSADAQRHLTHSWGFQHKHTLHLLRSCLKEISSLQIQNIICKIIHAWAASVQTLIKGQNQ